MIGMKIGLGLCILIRSQTLVSEKNLRLVSAKDKMTQCIFYNLAPYVKSSMFKKLLIISNIKNATKKANILRH